MVASDAWALAVLAVAGAVVLGLEGRYLAIRVAAPVLCLLVAYRAIARWANATEVDLEGGVLRVRQLGVPWFGPRHVIPASSIAQLGVVEVLEVSDKKAVGSVRRKYVRFALVARLSDGTKRVLVALCHAREPLEEAERAIERRLGIVDVPLHELPALPLRVQAGDELALPGADVHALEPGLVVEIGLPVRHGGYREAAVKPSPWLRVSETRASALRDLPLLLVAPLFALPAVVLFYNAPKLPTAIWIVATVFFSVLALAGYAVASGVIRSIFRLMRLEIRDGVVRTAHSERDASLIESVELGGEPGAHSVEAYTDGLAWQLLGALPSEAEARWLAARIREVLGLPALEPERTGGTDPAASREPTLPAEPPLG
jgi:hypothetical protein